MKTNKAIYGLLGLMVLASCSDKMDYNETVIKDKDYVTQTFEKVGGFMTDIYNYADYDYGQNYSGAMLASATDESVYSVTGTSIETFYNGSWSPSNAQGSLWTNMYKGIKTCNVVLKDFQDLKFSDLQLNADYKQQMYRYENYKWEARFWRAYFYFNLVRQYGGVPILDPDMAAADANNQPRKTSDEVFQFVIDECEAIKDSIIADYSDLGSMALSTAEDGARQQPCRKSSEGPCRPLLGQPSLQSFGRQGTLPSGSPLHQGAARPMRCQGHETCRQVC